MKAMRVVLVVGSAISAATALAPVEAVQAFTPFAVLSTGVLLLAYWLVADDQKADAHRSVYKRAA
jgi:hypothetical protein